MSEKPIIPRDLAESVKSIEKQPNNEKLQESDFAIIAPDDPSGRAFESKFLKQDLRLPYQVTSIRPRVIASERSTHPGVYADLLEAFRTEYAKGHSRMIIACNTLQFWAEELAEHPEIYEDMPKLDIYTTFQAAKEKYPDRETRPIWLGTSVTAKLLNKEEFDTPTNNNDPEMQDLVQEIIWRTKASANPPADYSGAGDSYENITDKELMKTKTIELISKMKEKGIKEFFLGCTELPIAFGSLDSEDLEGVTPVDLADIMAEKIKRELKAD